MDTCRLPKIMLRVYQRLYYCRFSIYLGDGEPLKFSTNLLHLKNCTIFESRTKWKGKHNWWSGRCYWTFVADGAIWRKMGKRWCMQSIKSM